MSLADTVRRLVEAGATPEVIMIAVEAIEAERKALDANREAARERKRRQRSRDVDVTVTGQDVTERDAASLPLPPSPQTPQPPTPTRVDNTPLPPEGRSRRKPTRSLPDNFPTEALIAEQQAKARDAGANVDIRRFAAYFRDQCLAKDHRYADWTAAWRNWCRGKIADAPKTPMAALAARPAQPEDERWRRWLREFRQNGHWATDDAGPRPGHPACRVPPALLAEFGYAPPPANDPTDLFDRGAAA